MNPTPRLRFVEREVRLARPDGDTYMIKTVRILQQWHEWEVTYPTVSGEWRDVPIEKEQK